MLEKIRHNLLMKILSVLIAVLFWFMVYTNENPIETRQMSISLTPINMNVLANDNLRILNEYETEVEITIRGRKSEIDKVDENDFMAYLDFSEINNEYAEYIDITGFKYLGEGSIISNLTGSGRIGLSIDRIVAGEIPIRVEIIGETAEGFFLAGKPVLQPANYALLDIKSLVTEISSAVVTVDVTGMKGTETVRKFCMIYDNKGEIINELSNKTAIDITVNVAKSVPVQVKLEGVPAKDYIETITISNPSHVLVSGSEEELVTIEKVSTLPVNIEGAAESFVVTTGLQTLPVLIGYVGLGEVEVTVSIEELKEKTINFSNYSIEIRYGMNNKSYDIINDQIQLTIKGRQSLLDVTTGSTVSAYIDVSNTEDGETNLPLRFENLDGVEQSSFPLVNLYIQTKKSIAVSTEDIFISGKQGGKYDYEFINTTASLNLIGLSDNITLVEYGNLNPTIISDELSAGTHTIPVQVNLPDGVSISGTFTTQIKITEK